VVRKRYRYRASTLHAMPVLLLAAATTQVLAQSTPAAAPPASASTSASPRQAVELDRVVVTATRRETTAAEIPYNIQVVTAETLQNIGASSLSDFVRTIPGMSFTDSGARGGINVSLRGLRTSSVADSTTSLYLDDVEIPSTLHSALVDIDRVEVLRGPQGTLYGSGAIGGTVRYVGATPTLDVTEGRVTTKISSTRNGGTSYDVGAMANLPIVDEVMAMRVNIAHGDHAGWVDNIQLHDKDINWDRNLAGRLAFAMQPNENLRLSLTHYLDRSDFGSFGNWADDIGELKNSYFIPAQADRDTDLTALVVNYDFDRFTLTSTTSRLLERSTSAQDQTAYIRDVIFASFLPPDMLPPFNEISARWATSETWSQEVRLVSDDRSRLTWAAGAYWTQEDSANNLQERVPIPFPGQAAFERDVIGGPLRDEKEYYIDTSIHYRQMAVFGELGFKFTPRWSASLGMRYFDYRDNAVMYSIDQYFGPSARNPDGTARTVPLPGELLYGHAEYNDAIFRFNTSYKFGESQLAYATIAEGFRPGGYNSTSPNTGISPEDQQYDPDSIISYEVGMKGALAGGRLNYSGALYYIDWSDMQTMAYTSLGFVVTKNAGRAASRGVELELSARNVLTDGLNLTFGYAYTDMSLKDTIPGLGMQGDNAPFVPRQSISLNTSYDFDVGEDLYARLNLLATYTGTSYTDFGALKPDLGSVVGPNPQYHRMSGYMMLGLGAELSSYRWTVRLGVDNLLDKLALVNADSLGVYAESPYRSPYMLYESLRPRTVSLGFTYRF